ncbi:MAG: ABC transporter ATP-binding protein [Planctomycetota bacterium]|jgi:ABC-2 type transport system ATP-binding protein
MGTIVTQSLRKEFSSTVAVNDVNLEIEQGQVVGLIGPNGAGKTTLLRMLATVLPPTDGTATISGYDLRNEPLKVRKKIGYLPDFFNLYNDLTLTECLDFFAHAYSVPKAAIGSKIKESLLYVDLYSKKDELIRHLSRGMIQRLGLATLLVRDPDMLLLDEPASGLDPIARVQLRDILTRLSGEGKTILISSHILTELSGYCSHVAIMNQGRLVMQGDVNQIEREISGVGKFTIKILHDSEKAETLIREFPAATLEKNYDSTFEVSFADDPTAVSELNAHLVKNGIAVVHLSERKTNLEDLFMEISREKNLQVS